MCDQLLEALALRPARAVPASAGRARAPSPIIFFTFVFEHGTEHTLSLTRATTVDTRPTQPHQPAAAIYKQADSWVGVSNPQPYVRCTNTCSHNARKQGKARGGPGAPRTGRSSRLAGVVALASRPACHPRHPTPARVTTASLTGARRACRACPARLARRPARRPARCPAHRQAYYRPPSAA